MLSLEPYVGGKDLSGFIRREPFKWLNLVKSRTELVIGSGGTDVFLWEVLLQ